MFRIVLFFFEVDLEVELNFCLFRLNFTPVPELEEIFFEASVATFAIKQG
jgi:hypothetical protein